ncbi:IS110 family transposase [Saccharopolyspora sp. ASAGF58]|uniref:IS110 family transposase n=1 Tax=Saccharopolyspora sp. ASAGF58 TaxID=2719023 RepID=UPI00144028A9|nr:IS110 family transposase [Saccharopolyspora sp. ASAGF58]QIZ34318.1 IS110 family transposase [Saccharopolyspora sp. ASAGF58]QIZ39034.1 IS110 family transposase [Saccharopolyspora sp. ASAGF58]
MTQESPRVIGGVDSHGQTHHGAVIDQVGRHLADKEFPTTTDGYRRLLEWMRSHGQLVAIGVEGTGAYGAELARVLTASGITVIEVDRPDRKTRRLKGKTDPIDAYAAATAVLAERATGIPKSRDGVVEAIRALRVTRTSAVKARTQAINQIHSLLVSAPAVLREQTIGLNTAALITTLARLRPGQDLAHPATATRAALRLLARRYQALDTEIAELDNAIAPLILQACPELLELRGVGTQTAGTLLVAAGDNPERMRSEAAFAHLTGAAPIPASSGRTDRHRLDRGGNRAANNALYTIVLVRMRHDERTRAYVERRTQEGLTKKDIIRCLKRYVAREVYHALTTTPTTQQTPPKTAA